MMFMNTPGSAAFYGVTITLTVLDVIAVFLRFFKRREGGQALKADDWLTIPALALNIGMSIAIWYGIREHAVGYPTPAVETRSLAERTPLDQVGDIITINEKVFYISNSMLAASLAFSKASILFFYRRIFCTKSRRYDIAVISISFMLVVVVIFGFGMTFAYVFACGKHFEYWWSSAGADLKAHCIDTQMLTYALSVSDFIIDVLIIAIPIPLVWRLHLSLKQKLGVIAVFSTAAIALVASLIKMLWFLWENRTPWDPSWDQDLLASTFLFWSIVESHVGLVAACLPTLRRCFTGERSLESVVRSIRTSLSRSSLHIVKSRTEKGSLDSRRPKEEVPPLPFHAQEFHEK